MAVGKNPRLTKGGKKGGKKKTIDPLSRKEWYDFKAPVPFSSKSFGKTLVTRTAGTRIASEVIKGRVVETSLADLKDSSEQMTWRKVKLVIDEVEGRSAKTTFYGLDMTRDKLCSFIRKGQTLIECIIDAKTNDGYILRVFVICFTKKRADRGEHKKTSYAKHSQVKEIRRMISKLVTDELAKAPITDIVQRFTVDSYVKEIEDKCKTIYPLSNITIRKVKVLKRPKIDALKLNEMYAYEKKAAEYESMNKKQGGETRTGDEETQNLLTKKKAKETKVETEN